MHCAGLYSSVLLSTRMSHHKGDVIAAKDERVELRKAVWAEQTPETVRATLEEYVPDVAHRVVVTLHPEPEAAAAAVAAAAAEAAAAKEGNGE